MSFRAKVALAVPILALFAAACSDVSPEAPPASFVVAAFDPGVPGVRAATIPVPNDLALQAAPSQTNPTLRAALFSFIDAGGFPTANFPTPGAPTTIVIPLRTMERDATTGEYAYSATMPPALDAASITASTVALVRVSGTGAPEIVPHVVAANVPGTLALVPATGLVAGTRYVVAVRGGPSGVLTTDGQVVEAERPIALVRQNVDLSFPENQPVGGLTTAQVTSLEQLRGVLRAPFDWGAVVSDPICRQALGIPADPFPFPEGRCWLPPLPPGTLSPGIVPAFNAVDLVFPHVEAVSIQTFEVAPAP